MKKFCIYTKKEKMIITFSFIIALAVIPLNASAMHIMEGFLPPIWAFSWGVLCVPFVVLAFFSLKKRFDATKKSFVLLALCGAFAFVLSALKIPSVTGSCSHPTGVGLGAIIFGPFAMVIISLIVLIFQAVLLAHGGITTLGANTFSMGIAGPFLSYFSYKLLKKLGVSTAISVFVAAFLGNIFTYVVTSFQLSFAHPSNGSVGESLVKFLGIFALTQIPLAICEGLLTVVIFNVLEKYSKKDLVLLGVLS